MAYFKPDPKFQKFLAPWDDAPGKGSRDILMQDAMGWGEENIGKYIEQNWGDPYGIFDPAAVNDYWTKVAGTAEGSEHPGNFTNFTLPQLQAYLTKTLERPAETGGWGNFGAGMYDKMVANNDLQWMPKFYEQDGKQYVTWGQKNSGNGGFLDKITPFVENALALSGFAAPALGASIAGAGAGLGAGALEAGALAGAPGYGAALESSLAGFGGLAGGGLDSSWGVNPQTGGSMDLGDWLNLDDIGSFGGEALRDVAIPGNGLTGIPNLQDIMVKLDALPPGTGSLAKSALQKVLGGTATAQDWTSLLGTLGATGLGMLGSNQQAKSLTDIANQARADRQPFLNQSLGWLANPASYYASEPAQAAMKGVLHGLSVNGNPANNPTAMASATEAGLRNWQNAVTGFGNIGLAGQDSRSQLLSNAATADRGVTASLASGLGTLTQPQDDLASMLRRLQMTGL